MESTFYHGSCCIVEKPEIVIGKYHKEFGEGFYCTLSRKEAERLAMRMVPESYVSTYTFTPGKCLSIRILEENDEWLNFIVMCMKGHRHSYDVVQGPMVDEQVFTYVLDFAEGKIRRQAFWVLVKSKQLPLQISFNTKKALNCLDFQGSLKINGNVDCIGGG